MRTMPRRPGEVGFGVISAISVVPLDQASGFRCHINALAFGQTHIRLAHAGLATGTEAEQLQLALDVRHVDRQHADVEQLFDRGLHVGLGGGRRHLENVLVVLGELGALLGDARRSQHGQDALVAHASHSSIFFTASTVITTWSAPTSATGFSPLTSTTSMIFRLLRAARNRFSLISSATIRVLPLASS